MKFSFQNLGFFQKADIELNDLTIICGYNNTGKTYITHCIYSFLKNYKFFLNFEIPKNLFDELIQKGKTEFDIEKLYGKGMKDVLEKAKSHFKSELPDFLAVREELLQDCEIEVALQIFDDVFSNEFFKKFDLLNEGYEDEGYIKISKPKNSNIVSILAFSKNDVELKTISKRLVEKLIITQILEKISSPAPFILSTERTGAISFKTELNLFKNRAIKHLHKLNQDDTSKINFIKEVFSNEYSEPIQDNVEFANLLQTFKKEGTFSKENPNIIKKFENIVGGKYITAKNGELRFSAKRTRFTVSESSSSVISLVMLYYYINYKAKVGDILIIDEPELNLHPKNQRKMAQLVALIVNAGIKVFITTHSDYFVKEINTLIMLNNKTKETSKIAEDYKYTEKEFLSPDKINIFITCSELVEVEGKTGKTRQNIIKKLDIDKKLGIEISTFDDEIDKMNEIQETLYDNLMFGE